MSASPPMLMRALLLISILGLSACDSFGDDGPPSIDPVDPSSGLEVVDLERLQEYEGAWNAAGFDNYRLRYEVVCYCAPTTIDLRVAGGRVEDVWVNGEKPVTDDVDALTIDRLYRLAAQGFQEADGVSVRVLEAAAPLPVNVYVDWSEFLADEEIGYRITGFEAE